MQENILTKLSEMQERDSGWALFEILYLKVNINTLSPINVGLSTYIKTPAFIEKTKSVIYIKNNDHYCFLWVSGAHLSPATSHKILNRISSYPHFSQIRYGKNKNKKLKYKNISFSISLSDISKFEKHNKMSINVLINLIKQINLKNMNFLA